MLLCGVRLSDRLGGPSLLEMSGITFLHEMIGVTSHVEFQRSADSLVILVVRAFWAIVQIGKRRFVRGICEFLDGLDYLQGVKNAHP